VYTEYAAEELRPIDADAPLPEFEFDPISNKNTALQALLLKELNIEGEIFYERSQFLLVIMLVKATLEVFEEVIKGTESKEYQYVLNLWRARHAAVYDQNLTSSTEALQSVILDSYEASVNLFREHLASITQDSADVPDELVHKAKSNLSMLLTEYSHPLIQYWKYEGCEAAIKEAFDLVGIQVDL